MAARPVVVVEYSPEWPAQFAELRRVLAAALGDVAVAIEHVGSTSVPGLAAKPILDVDVVIGSRAVLSEVAERLGTLGYAHDGDKGVTGREAFGPASHPCDQVPFDGSGRSWPPHHLYVCHEDADALRRHVALRDWLRSHDEVRDRYADLKRRLAERFRDDRQAYCDAKSGLLEVILTQALGIGFCTSRAVVRPFSLVDAPRAHPVFSDPEVMRFSSEEPDLDLATTALRLENYVRMQRDHGFSKWALWDRESGTYLGDAGLTVLAETGEIELGYRLGQEHWGRGLATEIAGAWLRYALEELGLPRIVAFADPRNPASIRVMEKVGMTFHRQDRLAGMECVVYEAVGGTGVTTGQDR